MKQKQEGVIDLSRPMPQMPQMPPRPEKVHYEPYYIVEPIENVDKFQERIAKILEDVDDKDRHLYRFPTPFLVENGNLIKEIIIAVPEKKKEVEKEIEEEIKNPALK